MEELISKVSKGSKMDQVYIPKNRRNFAIGTYVILKPLDAKKPIEKPYFYNIKFIEPIKISIIKEIFSAIDKIVDYCENVIVTGSFLDEGFNFNDIDIIIISENKADEKPIKKILEDKLKIKIHFIQLNNEALIKGLSTDPLYQMMLSKCIAKKRFIYKVKHKIEYKILDFNLLKSKLLVDNFDYLNGNEKYYLVRNMIAISLYIKHKKIGKEKIDEEIKNIFNLKDINEIKLNMLDKNTFLKRYKKIYNNIFNEIMDNIKNGTKQEKIN